MSYLRTHIPWVKCMLFVRCFFCLFRGIFLGSVGEVWGKFWGSVWDVFRRCWRCLGQVLGRFWRDGVDAGQLRDNWMICKFFVDSCFSSSSSLFRIPLHPHLSPTWPPWRRLWRLRPPQPHQRLWRRQWKPSPWRPWRSKDSLKLAIQSIKGQVRWSASHGQFMCLCAVSKSVSHCSIDV